MSECVLTVDEQKKAVIALVGSVNAEVRALLLKYIDTIWCAAQQHSCEYPLTLLYAQREAIDFALAKLAPFVSQKRGKTDAFRTAEGMTRSNADARTTQRGSGFSCDWSNTGSFAVHQNNSDSWSIGRSATDSSAQSFYYSHSWDRGRSRDDAQSRSVYERNANTTRRTESQDFSTLVGNSEGSERTASTEGVPHAILDNESFPITIAIPPFDIYIPIGGLIREINLPRGPDVQVGQLKARYENVMPCEPSGVGCPAAGDNGDLFTCGIIQDDQVVSPSVCNRRSYSTNSEVFTQVTIPVPFVGAFTFSGNWAKGYESRPRCGSSRSRSIGIGFSNSSVWMRGSVVGNGSSASDSAGTRQNDAHTRATGSSSSSNFSRSVGDAYTIAIGESHSGSDTNSHGESQSQDLGNSRSKSRGVGIHKTASDREHEFDIRMYSDAFKALNELRAKIVKQIEEALSVIGKQLYTNGKVRNVDKRCDINVYQLARGQASMNAICCTTTRTRSRRLCYVNSMA